MKSSVSSTLFDEQSASLPGRLSFNEESFLVTFSLAARDAKRASAASSTRFTTASAMVGFASR
jgi:hypothetical protein